MTNMLKKLNIKDFGKSSIKSLGIFSFKDLINLSEQDAKATFGDILGEKLLDRINEIKTKEFTDYRIIGSLGFSSAAADTFKLIFAQISLESIINKSDEELYDSLCAIKGIGKVTAESIIEERKYLMDDIIFISKMPNVTRTFGSNTLLIQVRFTGIRDIKLEEAFNKAGFDADGEKSVTKKTAILIIPYYGYTSSKTKKINPDCILMTVDDAYKYLKSKVGYN
jgi:NAD-dependent DNA ligase